jgi:hypothetical protein
MATARARRGTWVLVLLLAVAVGTLAFHPAPADHEPWAEVRGALPRFRVQGRVGGLYPGALKTMRVKVRNPYAFPIRIRRLRASVGAARPGCTAANLQVRRARANVVVRPRRTVRVRLRVRMRPSAPEACQGARFPLRFRATAVRA